MELIALRDFLRTPALENIEIQGALNSKHIHRGATFTIGAAKELKDLNREDRYVVAMLAFSKCIGDATDPKIVQAVKDEIEVDKRREAHIAKANAAALNAGLATQLANVLRGLVANSTLISPAIVPPPATPVTRLK